MDQKRTAKTLYVGHVPLGQMQLSRGEFLSVVSADVDPPNSYGDLSAVRILDEYATITIRGEPSYLNHENSKYNTVTIKRKF